MMNSCFYTLNHKKKVDDIMDVMLYAVNMEKVFIDAAEENNVAMMKKIYSLYPNLNYDLEYIIDHANENKNKEALEFLQRTRLRSKKRRKHILSNIVRKIKRQVY